MSDFRFIEFPSENKLVLEIEKRAFDRTLKFVKNRKTNITINDDWYENCYYGCKMTTRKDNVLYLTFDRCEYEESKEEIIENALLDM